MKHYCICMIVLQDNWIGVVRACPNDIEKMVAVDNLETIMASSGWMNFWKFSEAHRLHFMMFGNGLQVPSHNMRSRWSLAILVPQSAFTRPLSSCLNAGVSCRLLATISATTSRFFFKHCHRRSLSDGRQLPVAVILMQQDLNRCIEKKNHMKKPSKHIYELDESVMPNDLHNGNRYNFLFYSCIVLKIY
jgi:hypothetical protein